MTKADSYYNADMLQLAMGFVSGMEQQAGSPLDKKTDREAESNDEEPEQIQGTGIRNHIQGIRA